MHTPRIVTATVLFIATPAAASDLDGDCFVGATDLLVLVQSWGECAPPCAADLDGDGFVGVPDLILLLAEWETATPARATYGAWQAPLPRDRTFASAVFDIDGDGDGDFASVSTLSPEVMINVNGGDGTFETSIVELEFGPRLDVDAGDLDGDGDPDLVVPNLNTGTDVLRNVSGQFEAWLQFETPATRSAIIDVDGDQDLDVATIDRDTGTTIYLNDGAGSFDENTAVPQCTGFDLAFADLDGDSHLDLIAANPNDDFVCVAFNDGDGGFVGSTTIPTPVSVFSLATADVDGDGDIDVVTVAPWNDTTLVLVNDGDGGLEIVAALATPDVGTQIGVDDIDGDDIVELVVSRTATSTIEVYHDLFTGVPIERYAAGGKPTAVTLDDVDGDGSLDVVATSNYAETVTALLNDGSGQFDPFTATPSPNSATGVDLDGDGVLEIVTADMLGDTVTVLAFRDKAFATVASIDVPQDLLHVLAADLDGDGDDDVVSVHDDGIITALINERGRLTAEPAGTFDVGVTVDATIVVADLDDDGWIELILPFIGFIRVVEYTAGVFQPVFIDDSITDDIRRIVAIDSDGDGDSDLAYSTETAIRILRNDNGILVQTAGEVPCSIECALAAIDWDGDGDDDLVAADGAAFFYENDGGTFSDGALLATTGMSDERLIVADADGDGASDVLVLGREPSGTVILYGGQADGAVFAPRVPGGMDPVFAAVDDWNADGVRDLAIVDSGGSYVVFISGACRR